jgi:glycosyltransferase involved in cell wall biosynthesis
MSTFPVPCNVPLAITPPRRQKQLVIACILDEFSRQCFEPEADLVHLTPKNWEVQLCASQPDLLLVESAWRGAQELWWNTVPKRVPELLGILEWCRERGIPSAFWNKEDPVHFGTFLSVASEFDSVFTTDIDCVPRYKARLGHERVYFMPFAAQPALHNPFEVSDRVQGTAFAGAYYHKYPERSSDMEVLSDSLRERGRFDIFDRNFGLSGTEYSFPDTYRDDIVGGLKPNEIGIAYKGYVANLNLNSVKQSQSMFARRVFELMASNTLVLSNFSRGLRALFGDLTISTDDSAELNSALDRLERAPFGIERLRLAALRKVLSEHTYADRVAYLAQKSNIPLSSRQTRVLVVAEIRNSADFASIRQAVNRQTWSEVAVALHFHDEALRQMLAPGIASAWGISSPPQLLESLKCAHVQELAQRSACDLVSYFSAEDYYGPNFLTDAALSLGWTSQSAVGKARHFSSLNDSWELPASTGSFQLADSMPARACVIRRTILAPGLPDDFSSDFKVDGLAIDPFNYCRGGVGLPYQKLEIVNDLPIHSGMSLDHMLRCADAGAERASDMDGMSVEDLLEDIDDRCPDVSVSREDSVIEVVSRLRPGEHRYLYSTRTWDPSILGLEFDEYVFFECSPGLDVSLVFVFLAESGIKVGHAIVPNLTNVAITMPTGSVAVRIGLRIDGPGRASLTGFTNHKYYESSPDWIPTAENVILTNIYPSYSNLYRNGFVHTRAMAYRNLRHRVEVVIPRREGQSAFREFQGVDVSELSIDGLRRSLSNGYVKNVLVHFLDPLMWEALKDQDKLQGVYIWVHGSEIQPWWRRAYNYSDRASLEEAKVASVKRLELWREIFANLPANFHIIFVSEYFAEEVFEDVGIRLASDRYSIIHNPIDTSRFTYVPKPREQRRKILSIRPYASRKYANDLSVEAVRFLSERPGFLDLRFCFIGDGPLFDETIAPLRNFPNVEIRKQFLTHAEIAEVHKEFGVFLTPTRMDAQGVSRDEAMASGLVPVTTNVAAIPEFVDKDCGFMAPVEDAVQLAEAIWTLANDEELFASMSEAAARRVRIQTAADVVIPREIRLFGGFR